MKRTRHNTSAQHSSKRVTDNSKGHLRSVLLSGPFKKLEKIISLKSPHASLSRKGRKNNKGQRKLRKEMMTLDEPCKGGSCGMLCMPCLHYFE